MSFATDVKVKIKSTTIFTKAVYKLSTTEPICHHLHFSMGLKGVRKRNKFYRVKRRKTTVSNQVSILFTWDFWKQGDIIVLLLQPAALGYLQKGKLMAWGYIKRGTLALCSGWRVVFVASCYLEQVGINRSAFLLSKYPSHKGPCVE